MAVSRGDAGRCRQPFTADLSADTSRTLLLFALEMSTTTRQRGIPAPEPMPDMEPW